MTFEELMKNPIPAEMRRDANINEGVDCGTECGDGAVVPEVSPENVPSPTPIEPVPPVVATTPDPDPEAVVGKDPEFDPNLTPDESKRVDDVINTVATPILLNSELDDADIKEFVEGLDIDIAVAEGFLTERTIVRFDKNAKKAQLYEVAVRAVAREKKDPLYRKLETLEKMKRIIEAKLRAKYDSPARRKVKEYIDRAKKSKSTILSKIAHKLSKK